MKWVTWGARLIMAWRPAWPRPDIAQGTWSRMCAGTELRTPLTIIQGDLQAILRAYRWRWRRWPACTTNTLLTRLVDDLHDLALAEAGQLRLEHAPVGLVALAGSCHRSLRSGR